MQLSPIQDLVVVDVSRNLAGAFASSLLADFGATVVVVEPPEDGAAARSAVAYGAREAWWRYIGRGKRSVGLNPRAASASGVIELLVANADLLVTDTGPRGWKRDAWLKHVPETPGKPLVLDLHATGEDRPDLWKEGVLAAFAPAVTGMMNLTGWADGPPAGVEAPVAEYLAAMMGTMGALAELRAMKRGRPACHVSMALHEAVQRMIEWQLPIAALGGEVVRRNGNNFPMNAGISNMPLSKDGRYVTFSAASQEVATRLLNLIGGAELAQDPRFATVEARQKNMDALYERIDAWCAQLTVPEILEKAKAADVVAGPIYDANDILNDPEIGERASVVRRTTSDGAAIAHSAVAPRVKGLSLPPPGDAPAPGRDNDWLLGLAGATPRQHARWVETGVLWRADAAERAQ